MLKQQDDHPNFQHKWEATKKTDMSGEIEGIQLVCDQIPPAPASIPFPSKYSNVNDDEGGTDIVYDSATGEVSRAASSPKEQI